jgi:hypothetical protein
MKIFIPFLFIISVLISFVTTGCSPTSSDSGTITLYGIVTDSTASDSKRISGATALLEQTGETTLSDSTGIFKFTELSSGTYTVLVTKPGYYRYTTSIEIASEDTIKWVTVPLIFRNIYTFDNIIMNEYLSGDSYSAANFFTGQRVQDNTTDKDIIFRDTLVGADTIFYIASANMDLINTGYETWFTNMLETTYSKTEFDTMTRFPTADWTLNESDFTHHEGIDRYLSLGDQNLICAFYLKGRYVGSTYRIYGLMYIDSVWYDASNIRKILVDIKINKMGVNNFNPSSLKK